VTAARDALAERGELVVDERCVGAFVRVVAADASA
jgi:hypothetical protein